jgi:hypothetical protein
MRNLMRNKSLLIRNHQKSISVIHAETQTELDENIFNVIRLVELSWIMRLIEHINAEIFIHPYKMPLEFKINPLDKENERLIADALTPGTSNLETAVMDFFKDCIAYIIGFEEATYEAVFFQDETGKKLNFELESIYPHTIIREDDKIFQYLNTNQRIELPSENIKFFKLPEDLNKKLEEVRTRISDLGPQSKPGIPMFELVNAGRPLSWNPWYGLDKDEITKNKILEHLEFVKFTIEIRDDVLKQLNKHISDIGEEIGITAQIEIDGLLNQDDITHLAEEFIKGTKTPRDVINFNLTNNTIL